MVSSDVYQVDVAIIGGGPAGSTCATLLKKYNPDLKVLILEKAKFPREHVGESQLPVIGGILDEMGVWDKVEAAQFPIKIGASYTWGQNKDIWDFDFYPAEEFVDEPRPAMRKGQRTQTAFQVERAIYDDILLRHAEENGVDVREETQVRDILIEGDRVDGFVLDSGMRVEARYYIDASGHAGLMRRALGVESEAPKALRNIAMWDYWDNAKWKVEIGVGGTRVQVRSLPYGWIWFIPLGPSKASVGLICPSDYYKERGLSPSDLYHAALEEQGEIKELLKDASSTTGGKIETTKNWSHLADRLAGENWMLCGESAGFADPILAAGMTLAHGSARECAYTILELERGTLDSAWLKKRYDERNRGNIKQHIRFAEYWYAANGCFTDLQEHCQEIAKSSGIRMDPAEAWRWLAQGGFTTEDLGRATFGSFDIGSSKQIMERFHGKQTQFKMAQYNTFKLNLLGAKEDCVGDLKDGRIHQIPCYRRGNAMLPVSGHYKTMINVLKQAKDITGIYNLLAKSVSDSVAPGAVNAVIFAHLQVLEAMLHDRWVVGSVDKKKGMWSIADGGGRLIRNNVDGNALLADKAKGTVKFAGS